LSRHAPPDVQSSPCPVRVLCLFPQSLVQPSPVVLFVFRHFCAPFFIGSATGLGGVCFFFDRKLAASRFNASAFAAFAYFFLLTFVSLFLRIPLLFPPPPPVPFFPSIRIPIESVTPHFYFPFSPPSPLWNLFLKRDPSFSDLFFLPPCLPTFFLSLKPSGTSRHHTLHPPSILFRSPPSQPIAFGFPPLIFRTSSSSSSQFFTEPCPCLITLYPQNLSHPPPWRLLKSFSHYLLASLPSNPPPRLNY